MFKLYFWYCNNIIILFILCRLLAYNTSAFSTLYSKPFMDKTHTFYIWCIPCAPVSCFRCCLTDLSLYQPDIQRGLYRRKGKNWKASWLQHCCGMPRVRRLQDSSALQAICPSMLLCLLVAVLSLVGGTLLRISHTAAALRFWLFLVAPISAFCSSSDSPPICITSLYWCRYPSLNIHFVTFPAISRSFRARSKSCLVCIDTAISILSLRLSSIVSQHSIAKWAAVSDTWLQLQSDISISGTSLL